jgi:hypothetical protein
MLMVGACAPDQPIVGSSESSAMLLSKGGPPITPRCVEGCNDPDPDPDAVGYFLPGLENQFAHCSDGDIDLDQDGLDDGCELALALAFAPQMSFAYGDDVNREPRWAAQWLDGDPGSYTVRIAYLHSYWSDMGLHTGAIHAACLALGGGFQCGPHAGDSEWITLDVRYQPSSQHWFVTAAKFSAHDWHVPFTMQSDSNLISSSLWDTGTLGWNAAPLIFPDKRGGFPLVYAADRKHANYPTISYCDSHGAIVKGVRTNLDSCDGQRYLARLEVIPNRNIGSRHAAFLDCVGTTRPDHPTFASGKQECYWTDQKFAGWYPAHPDVSSTAYSVVLSDLGF